MTAKGLCRRWTESLVSQLGFQVAGWFKLDPGSRILQPILWQTPSGQDTGARPATAPVVALLLANESGSSEAPDVPTSDDVAALGATLGLQRFHWYVAAPVPGRPS